MIERERERGRERDDWGSQEIWRGLRVVAVFGRRGLGGGGRWRPDAATIGGGWEGGGRVDKAGEDGEML